MKRWWLGALVLVLVILAIWLSLRSAPVPEELPSLSVPRVDVVHTAPAPDVRVQTPTVLADVSSQQDSARPQVSGPGTRVYFRGGWGEGPEQFGRRGGNESNLEGPTAVFAGARGNVWMLDQVRRRAVLLREGRIENTVTLSRDTVQELTELPSGGVVLLDRLADRSLTFVSAEGVSSSVPLEGGAVHEGGAVTGVFADREGVYVEVEHAQVVRVADAQGRPDASRPTLWGRPSRDGRMLLRAAIESRRPARAIVRAQERAGNSAVWELRIALDDTVLQLVLLDTDAAGNTYLGAALGRETVGTPPFDRERVVVVKISPTGTELARLELPPLSGTMETVHPLSVSPDGVVHELVLTEAGPEVHQAVFP